MDLQMIFLLSEVVVKCTIIYSRGMFKAKYFIPTVDYRGETSQEFLQWRIDNNIIISYSMY